MTNIHQFMNITVYGVNHVDEMWEQRVIYVVNERPRWNGVQSNFKKDIGIIIQNKTKHITGI